MADENTNPPNTPPASTSPNPSTASSETPPASSSPATQPNRSEMNAAIEKARGEEKAKQFENIQRLEKQIETIQGEKVLLEAQIKTLTDSVGVDNKIDIKKVIEDVTIASANLHKQSTQELTRKLESMQADSQRERLERLRLQLIADAGGPDNLIASLVRGNTEEEIRASVEESKSEFLKVKARFDPPPSSTTAPATTQNPITTTPPPPVVPAQSAASGRGAGADVLEQGKVKEMSPDEYAANRKVLHKELKDRYQIPARR